MIDLNMIEDLLPETADVLIQDYKTMIFPMMRDTDTKLEDAGEVAVAKVFTLENGDKLKVTLTVTLNDPDDDFDE